MKLVLFALGGVPVLLSVLERVRSAKWWIRFADFPRIQIAIGLHAVLMLQAVFFGWDGAVDIHFTVAVLAALA